MLLDSDTTRKVNAQQDLRVAAPYQHLRLSIFPYATRVHKYKGISPFAIECTGRIRKIDDTIFSEISRRSESGKDMPQYDRKLSTLSEFLHQNRRLGLRLFMDTSENMGNASQSPKNDGQSIPHFSLSVGQSFPQPVQ